MPDHPLLTAVLHVRLHEHAPAASPHPRFESVRLITSVADLHAALRAWAAPLAQACGWEAAPAPCQHGCCVHALPGHRTPLARGADGRPDYEDYTY